LTVENASTKVRRVIQREHDGVRWELQPDFAPLLDELLKSPGETVKESPVKRVTRHQLGAKSFYIKRYFHHAVPLRPLKFFFKATQARQEWELARQLEARRIPIVRHVGLGERWTWHGVRESILVTEGFDGAPLSPDMEVDPSAVLELVRRMHDQGVLQKDLHPGNLLVKENPFELRLVDLHGTVVREKLSAEERRKNLALLRVYLPVRVTPAVEEQSRELRRQLLCERSLRCLRSNRDFARQRHGNLVWQVRLPFLSHAGTRVLSAPDDFLATRAKILKPGKTSTVGMHDGLVLKRFNFRKPGNLLKDLFRPSRARRAFLKGYHLELAGIPTARSIATADRRFYGFLVRSYLLMEEIPGAVDLTKYFREGGKPAPKLVRDAARLIAKLHNEGFSHRDLKESNLVLDGNGELHLIDLDGVTFLQNVPDDRVAFDLARLGRGVARYPAVMAKDRILFLLTYCRARGIRCLPRLPQSS
jgi:tRNA A-37 threonylcarbamoyl transferase component Bud32